ncbi:MAG: glycosyltransferase N-terminal domain-containing protein [Geminicoccaceae bacterium]
MPAPPEAARPVWIAATGIAEVRSVVPLVAALEARGLAVVLSVATADGLRLAADLTGAAVVAAPGEDLAALDRFLAAWRPRLLLLVEDELGPERLELVAARGIPAVVVGGRLPLAALGRWRGQPERARAVFGRLALVLAQGRQDAARFRELGAPRVEAPGSLKTAVAPLPADPAELVRLRAAIGPRPAWVAASLHPGEEAAVIAAHRRVAALLPDLLTIAVPRHPADAAAMQAAFAVAGLACDRRSTGALPRSALHVADTVGELGLWYRLARIAFVGGSLVAEGGHNPVEPARLGCPLLLGPHLDDVIDLARPLLEAGAALPVADADELAATLAACLADPPRLQRMAGLALAASAAGAGIIASVMQRLAPWLG